LDDEKGIAKYPAAPPTTAATGKVRLGRYLVAIHEGASLLLDGISSPTWAEGRQRTFFEVLAGSFSISRMAYDAFTLRIRPVDASMLIEEVIAATRRGHTVAAMDLFHFHIVRGLAPPSVIAAVDERLPAAALSARLDVEAALSMWDVMRSDLRIIDMPEVDPNRYPGLARRDPTDLEVQALSDLLGVPAWASDPDLIVEAKAVRYDRASAYEIGDLAAGEGAAAVGTAVTAGIVRGAAELSIAGVRALAARPVVLGSALAVCLILAWRRRKDVAARLGPHERWREAFETAGLATARGIAWHHALQRRTTWEPEFLHDLPLTTTLARSLASAPMPMSAAQISVQLSRRSIRVSEREIRACLRSSALFVRSPRGHWQLGHDSISARAPFRKLT
jgi:hypothetical protein